MNERTKQYCGKCFEHITLVNEGKWMSKTDGGVEAACSELGVHEPMRVGGGLIVRTTLDGFRVLYNAVGNALSVAAFLYEDLVVYQGLQPAPRSRTKRQREVLFDRLQGVIMDHRALGYTPDQRAAQMSSTSEEAAASLGGDFEVAWDDVGFLHYALDAYASSIEWTHPDWQPRSAWCAVPSDSAARKLLEELRESVGGSYYAWKDAGEARRVKEHARWKAERERKALEAQHGG